MRLGLLQCINACNPSHVQFSGGHNTDVVDLLQLHASVVPDLSTKAAAEKQCGSEGDGIISVYLKIYHTTDEAFDVRENNPFIPLELRRERFLMILNRKRVASQNALDEEGDFVGWQVQIDWNRESYCR
jgi:hypothetical protein